jgi:hypothetical protein
MAPDPSVPSDDAESTRTAPSSEEERSAARELARWGDFRVIREIGRGAFGRVYRAWDDDLHREVALKIIRPRDAAHRTAVLREGQMLARVKHQNVVTIFRAQQIGDEVGLTMELIQGRHLAALVRDSGPMGADEATVVGLSLCAALAAVHGAGVLHRDVKAHNVMRESGGRIVLMDFGAGREAGPEREGGAELSGTPLYLAPELFAGQPASPASDLYSVGVLLFYLVTRRYPVEGANLADLEAKHAARARRLLPDVRADLPASFVRVVHRALSPDPRARPQTAGEMMAELADAMPNVARQATTRVVDAEPPPPQRGLSAGARVAIGAAAAVVSVGVLGVLTSAHYNRALGRDAGFSDDTMLTWFEMGLRALIAPAVWVVILLIVSRAVGATWHFTQRAVPPARRVTEAARMTISGSFMRLTGSDAASKANALLLLQVVGFVAFVWIFRDVLATLPHTVNDAAPGTFDVLDEDSRLLIAYPFVLGPLLAAMTVAWRRILRASAPPRATVVAGLTMVGVGVLLLTVPFRLFVRSAAPAVRLGTETCFLTGERSAEALLYCPGRPQHQRVISVPKADVQPGTGTRRIFSKAVNSAN